MKSVRTETMFSLVDYDKGRMALPMNTRLKGSEVSDIPMVDDFDETTQHRDSPKSVSVGDGDAEGATMKHVERSSLAASLRMIILLSLICWAVLLAVIAWIFA